MGGFGGGGGGGSLRQQALALTLYSTLNLFLNFFNKWALGKSGAGFSFPVFYSMFHMLMSLVGSLVLMKVRPPPTGMPSLQQFGVYKWEALTLALCSTVNITCNNASLMIIGLFVNQVIKALAPLLSMIFSRLILKKTYTPPLIASVIVIAIGAGMAVPFKDPSVTVLGVVLVSVATVASSTKPVVGELLINFTDKPKLAPAALVFYDSYWLSVPMERTGSIAYLQEKPMLGMGIICAGSLAAFGYNMSVFYYTMVASALALMVSTNLLKVVLITIAAIMENVTFWVNILGIIIFYTAIGVYAYLSFAQKQKKAAQPAPAATGAAPTEKTKLVTP